MAFEAAMILLQALFGLSLFLSHGLAKLADLRGAARSASKMGFGPLAGYYSAFVEGIAALLLALSVFPRIMASLIAINMLGAMMFHWQRRDGFSGGWEPAFLYFAAAIVIVIGGFSPWSLILG